MAVIRRKYTKTIGGKFNSIGDAKQQSENVALVTRLVGEIGIPAGRTDLTPDETAFLIDTRAKLNSPVNRMFGWRQVEEIVRIHAKAVEGRKGASGADKQ
jgi:hypothetical protein